MKLFKNKFIASTFILILSGLSTKAFGLIIKVIFTRVVGTNTISLYTLVMPTYSLLLTIGTLAMPTTIAKIIAENDDKKALNNALIIIILLNAALVIIMFIFSHYIANHLLKEPKTYYLLIAMSLTLPFSSIACIFKGYFYGKQKMIPHVLSNTTEQIIRLLLVIFIIPKLIKISYVHAAVGLILTFLFTEAASIIVFSLCMPNKDLKSMFHFSFNKNCSKNIIDTSVPLVASKIIGNICYFLEPIILTHMLSINGYTINYIITEYGAYNAYGISTLTIPSFFISAISLALLPEIAKYKEKRNMVAIKKRFYEAILFTFIIGFISTFCIFVFRYQILMLLYKTLAGVNYIKYLAPFFILFYFENVFSSFMQAIGKAKITLNITITSSIIKVLSQIVLSYLKLGMNSLIIAEIINIIFTVISNYIYIAKYLKNGQIA